MEVTLGRSPQMPDIYRQFAAVKRFSMQVCCQVHPPSPNPSQKTIQICANPMTQHGLGRVGAHPWLATHCFVLYTWRTMRAGYIPNSVVRHTLQIHKPRPPEKPKEGGTEFRASDRLRAVSYTNITACLSQNGLLTFLFCALLEFNSPLWSPHYKHDIELIEHVQRRFTKRLPGYSNLTYKDRLALLNLPSLELRRLRLDLISCYKILFGLTSINSSELFELRQSTTRGHPYKLFKSQCTSVVRSIILYTAYNKCLE